MHSTLTTLINRLDSPSTYQTEVIAWGAPVPAFGDLSRSQVATLGLNPSNREFVDESGEELRGSERRFHTLRSLGIDSWSDVESRHLHQILDSCRTYFLANPYDRWFKPLDQVISGVQVSYYSASNPACHLDLIPYATARKWGELSVDQQGSLKRMASDSLTLLLRNSPVRLLVLNGISVVKQFEDMTSIKLERYSMREWTLQRNKTASVNGFGYKGWINSLDGLLLDQKILVVGYNHNIQSSFGVTADAIAGIRSWIAQAAQKEIH